MAQSSAHTNHPTVSITNMVIWWCDYYIIVVDMMMTSSGSPYSDSLYGLFCLYVVKSSERLVTTVLLRWMSSIRFTLTVCMHLDQTKNNTNLKHWLAGSLTAFADVFMLISPHPQSGKQGERECHEVGQWAYIHFVIKKEHYTILGWHK